MYYINAECLARKGDSQSIKQAMDVVNKVRKTRILPEYYKDFIASNTKEAMELIIKDKSSEYTPTFAFLIIIDLQNEF